MTKTETAAAAIATTLDAYIARKASEGAHNAVRSLTLYRAGLIAHASVFAALKWNIPALSDCALYTLDKVVKIARAIKTGVPTSDGNVRAVFLNALAIEGALTNAECNTSCSRFVEVEGARDMAVRHRVSVNTAGTQASYARSAMEYCGIGAKGARDFALTQDSASFKAFRAVMSPLPVSAPTEDAPAI